MRNLTYLLIVGLLAGIGLSGCSTASSAFSKGEELEAEGKYEEAMYSYADAFRNDPDAGEYRIRFFKARERAAELRYRQGTRMYGEGNYAAALAEFQAGQGIDPTQGRFEQLVERTRRLKDTRQAYQEGLEFEKGNKFKDANRMYNRALELEPGNDEYRTALARVLGLRRNRLDHFELSLKSARPITLKFRDARIKDVFGIITQLSGINFIFDEGIKDQPVTIYLENATFQQALDLLTNMYKLGRKVANESTVIIYPRTPEKSKQYEDMTLRTFHLNYLEAKKAINLIRTLLQVRKIYVNEESNAIVVRDSRDVVDVVEKILDASDVPDAELILDVEVLEIGDTDSKNVGLLLSPYNVQMGAFNSAGQPLSSTLSTTTSGDSTTTSSPTDQLIKVFSSGGYGAYATVPTATFNFGKTLVKSEVLSNPKIRVKNREKAKFTVGKRIPITTSNTTNETVSVNVQYIDVGVKLNAEPTILRNNEIVIKLGLEVSQDTDRQTVGSDANATTVVTIATRNLETVLSLKDGETSVIGGLIEKVDSNNKSKIFLLSDIPLLGELLTNTESSNRKSELVLAITPRLVRGVTVPENGLASFASGKEDDPALGRSLASFDQEPLFDGPKPPPPAPAPQGATPPAVTPQPVPQPEAQPEVQPELQSEASPAADAAQPAPAAGQKVMLQVGAPPSVASGEQFTLEVKLGPVNDLVKAPFVLGYDPLLVEFVAVNEGEFLKRDGVPTVFGNSVSPAAGSVTVNLGREEGRAGISGEGTLASLLFRAKQKGAAAFSLRDAGFSRSGGGQLELSTSGATVEIQ
jgi:general secretion pathway protein D